MAYVVKSDGTVVNLMVTAGLEGALGEERSYNLVRPPESDSWVGAGSGIVKEHRVDLTLLVTSMGGVDAANLVNQLDTDLKDAVTLYVEDKRAGNTPLAAEIKAYAGISAREKVGSYAYRVTATLYLGKILQAFNAVDHSGNALVTDSGDNILLVEEV